MLLHVDPIQDKREMLSISERYGKDRGKLIWAIKLGRAAHMANGP